MRVKNKLTVVAVSLFTLAIFSGCATQSRHHTYFFGKHVMSEAEKDGPAPPPRGDCPPGEFFALSW